MLEKQKYNKLNKDELEGIIRYFRGEVDSCTKILGSIMAGKIKDKSSYMNVLKTYGNLKEELKEIYHYVGLERNQTYVDEWYPVFKSAIVDMYIHAAAPKNTSDMKKLQSALYDIWDYAGYALYE